MGQVLHKRAKTTHAIRKEIQESKETIVSLCKKFNLNPRTVAKWRNRDSVEDAKMWPKRVRTVLTDEEIEIICTFRRSTKLALDDCYISLKETIPNLSRSNLHRCLKRKWLSVLPKDEYTDFDWLLFWQEEWEKLTKEEYEKKYWDLPWELNKKWKWKFKKYDIWFVHIDITKIMIWWWKTEDWKPKKAINQYLFVAIDRWTKFVTVKLYNNMTIESSKDFLQEEVINKFPYKISKILTDNWSQFTYKLLNKQLRPREEKEIIKTIIEDWKSVNIKQYKKIYLNHPFDQICKDNDISHRLTKFAHPWTNWQVEVFNKTIKENTTKKYHYETKEELEKHLIHFINFYNFWRKLKSLKFKTPFEKAEEEFEKNWNIFSINPVHYMAGLNT